MPSSFRRVASLALLLGSCAAVRADTGLLPPQESLRVRAVLAVVAEDGLEAARYRAIDGSALRSALLSYMRDMTQGRSDLRRLDSDIELPAGNYDAGAVLQDALQNQHLDEMLASLPPGHPQYRQLKQALARYRAIAAQGGWPAIPEGADESLVRRRLAFEDDQAVAEFDMTAAVRRFQARHGLETDGVVGTMTRAALNIPAHVRADSIAANMERWRWLPRALEPSRIVINAAAAELELWLDGKVVLTSRVIVGRPQDRTPILRAEGSGVTANPPWTVPASIAAREILPKLKANRTYLASQDMVLLNGPPGDPHGLSVDWRRIPAGTFPFRIRQHPGPRNPLGRVKIELPNRFDVYLHDTPGKSAFGRARRDLSHGCVRVEQIVPLASYALAADLSAVKMIANAVEAGATRYLPLQKTLPVYFLYWTAFPQNDGTIAFRSDIYGRDRRLIAALRAPTQQIATHFAGCARG